MCNVNLTKRKTCEYFRSPLKSIFLPSKNGFAEFLLEAFAFPEVTTGLKLLIAKLLGKSFTLKFVFLSVPRLK